MPNKPENVQKNGVLSSDIRKPEGEAVSGYFSKDCRRFRNAFKAVEEVGDAPRNFESIQVEKKGRYPVEPTLKKAFDLYLMAKDYRIYVDPSAETSYFDFKNKIIVLAEHQINEKIGYFVAFHELGHFLHFKKDPEKFIEISQKKGEIFFDRNDAIYQNNRAKVDNYAHLALNTIYDIVVNSLVSYKFDTYKEGGRYSKAENLKEFYKTDLFKEKDFTRYSYPEQFCYCLLNKAMGAEEGIKVDDLVQKKLNEFYGDFSPILAISLLQASNSSARNLLDISYIMEIFDYYYKEPLKELIEEEIKSKKNRDTISQKDEGEKSGNSQGQSGERSETNESDNKEQDGESSSQEEGGPQRPEGDPRNTTGSIMPDGDDIKRLEEWKDIILDDKKSLSDKINDSAKNEIKKWVKNLIDRLKKDTESDLHNLDEADLEKLKENFAKSFGDSTEISQKIKDIFKSIKVMHEEWLRKYVLGTKGTLDVRRVPANYNNLLNDPSVFLRRKSELSTSVMQRTIRLSLVVDLSGSMERSIPELNKNIIALARAVVFANQDMQQDVDCKNIDDEHALFYELGVYGFSDRYIEVFPNCKPVNNDELLIPYNRIKAYGGTYCSSALSVLYEFLRKDHLERKNRDISNDNQEKGDILNLVIVITDGEDIDVKSAQHYCNEIKDKDMLGGTVAGIFVGNDMPSTFCSIFDTDGYAVPNIEALPGVLNKILEENIRLSQEAVQNDS